MTKKPIKLSSIQLSNGETIAYQLERRARRTVGLKITADGLVVHAPKYILEFQLKKLIQEKSNWIVSKLDARKQNHIPPIIWQDGETLQLLGNAINLNVVQDAKNKQAQFNHDSLTITSPQADDEAVIKHKVIQWYKKQAEVDFGRRLAVLAAKLGVSTPPLKLSSAQSRWGSCSSRGDIRLNWRLLQAPPHIINYVVCHELAHLKEMNHSAKFWAVVESIYPDYKLAEKELKQLSPQLHRM
ncbi:MAG: M48 family metallopeptidase [Betaproteobacteria bacterium]|jgi:predicted metal-dependent hydrolase|nr:M48 family metallopeptidase [Betaproteobacteria bacterium]MCH9848366.1 M48 family metallopeptidase [Betaproteobacteria bacterium]MDG1097608.1 SprT family zinc-dependent metalloprotease [Methylophilaceae bacterium]MDG1454041.1 SprT family zinc-dependent metalloprotease [Methylophilaceae bacterium]